MRTTLDIDDDVLNAAKERARLERKTVGEVVSDLLRKALNAPFESLTVQEPETVYGFTPFPRRGKIVTNDVIDRLRDDDVY